MTSYGAKGQGLDEKVVDRSKALGWQTHYYHGQPRIAQTTVQGDGSVTFGYNGAAVFASTTSGDLVRLMGDDPEAGEPGGEPVKSHFFAVFRWDFHPYSDLFEVGNGFRNAHLDLKNGVFDVDGTTKPISLPLGDAVELLHIEIDWKNNETTAYRRGNGISENITISKTPQGLSGRDVVRSNSNGNGEYIHIYSAARFHEIEK